METIVHFIDVGQGNMVLIETSNKKFFVFDCNITSDNETRVINYVERQIGYRKQLAAFICSHRDADHMRGVNILNNNFPIQKIWDSGYPGTTTDSIEYSRYMNLRRSIGVSVQEKRTYMDYEMTRLRFLSAQDNRLPENANAQGLVIKVEHRNASTCGSSTILTGDCDAETWRAAIVKDYNDVDLKADILMAGHHGSLSFFDDPADSVNYYETHMRKIKPTMTIISVGDNPHGHPNKTAVRLYEKHSKGSSRGNKVFSTKQKGNMKLTLKDSSWSLDVN